ncbi:MAG: hypothetical protein HC916_07130 [Coleofasciculaceae cyanobacterium SM2_1_6]|nr:hypothetical protein [Coleofasciculaceae cyanobacterium SM2_1_6]
MAIEISANASLDRSSMTIDNSQGLGVLNDFTRLRRVKSFTRSNLI